MADRRDEVVELGALMKETPFFFSRGEATLFGLLHSPAGLPRKTAFVMSHPLAEEKLWSHRVFVSFARALAAKGYVVLRFDYAGAGDSSGTTAETSLSSHLEDLKAAVRELKSRNPDIEQVGLVGLRLGATVAALLADQAAIDGNHDLLRQSPLVLWEPIVDGESYFQEVLRSNLTTQLAVYGKVRESREALQEKIRGGGTVNVDGYEIGNPLYDSCCVRELLPNRGDRHGGAVLVVQIASGEQARTRDDLVDLAQQYRAGSYVRVSEQPFWREIKPFYGRAEELQRVSLNWLEQGNV